MRSNLSFPLAFGALVMGAMAMGISPIFVRNADVGPYASAFWRVALAMPVLWLWASIEAKRAGVAQRDLWQINGILVLSGLFFAGDLFFWHLAIVNTTIANATFLATLAPVWVVLGSGIFIGEPVARATYLGLAICLIGATTLIGANLQLAPDRLIGDIYGFITSIFFGAYFLAVRVARRKFGGGHVTFASSITTMLVLLAIALVLEPTLVPKSAEGVFSLLALGVVSHAGGQGLLAIALGALTAAFSSLVIFIEAVAAAIFAWIFAGEPITIWQVLGGGFILLGVWVARPRGAG